MGLKNYFNRSYAKVQPSPNSFSSDDSVSTSGQHKRGSSRFKWSYSRPGRADGSNECGAETSKNNNCTRTKETMPGTDKNDGRGSRRPPPPLSPSASPELSQALDYFDITPEANFTKESVKKKYKRLSLVHHPDRNSNAEKSIQEMQRINHYYDILEDELDRLEDRADDEDDSLSSPRSSSSSKDDRSGDDDGKERNERKKDKERRKHSWTSSRRRSSSVPRRNSMHRRRSKSRNPEHERRRRRGSTEPKKTRRRCTSTERRQRQEERQQERQDMEQEMRREWNDNARKMDKFRRKQIELRQWSNQRYAIEKLDTDWGRDQAFNAYTKQVQVYRNQIELMKNTDSDEFTSERTTSMPTKPNYSLMECSNEDVAVAMRLGETGIAIEIVDQEISNMTEEWILMKMRTSTSTSAGPGVYESTSKRGISVQQDRSYCKRILQLLTCPLDKDGNSMLHYAVYTEDHEMISYLIQIARQNKVFAKFVCYMNCRGLNAGDFTVGCTGVDSPVPSLMAALTKEAVEILDEKERRRAGRHQQDRKLFDHPIADAVFNVFMCLVVGRYVTCSGRVVSCVIIVLAHLVELWNKSTPAIRVSKAFFFTLHTGWYLLVGILLKGLNIILFVGESIPIPWQLQIVGVLALPFVVNIQYWPLRYLLRATILIESNLISGLEWIISRNGTFSSGYTKHFVDYAILSVPFVAIQLLCAMNMN